MTEEKTNAMEQWRFVDMAMSEARLVVAGWGVNVARARLRSLAKASVRSVESIAQVAGVDLHCLGTTKDGLPRHPLYLGYNVPPESFRQ